LVKHAKTHELKEKNGQFFFDTTKNNTSNPHVQGAHIVIDVIGDPTMFDEWKSNM
jgi:aspartate/tyrosine/aromatic aminotransferase